MKVSSIDGGVTGEKIHAAKILIVDDHPMWREGIARDLTEAGYEVTAAVGAGTQAVRIAAAVRPEVVILDLQLPDLSGVDVIRGLLDKDPSIRILMLSASGGHQDVLDAIKAGAIGYLLKSVTKEDFLDAVARTVRGDPVFTPGFAALVIGEFRRMAVVTVEDDTPRLTSRETEVLRFVAKGFTYRQIADRWGLSHRTIQNHVHNIFGKLQLRSRVDLVRYAMERGLDN